MAAQALGAPVASPSAQPLGDRARAGLAQHREGAAVRAGRGRRILPEHDLVLADAGAVAVAAAVAGGAAAGRDADIIAAGVAAGLLDCLRVGRAEQQEEQAEGGQGGGAQTDRDVAAAPHSSSMPPVYSAKEVASTMSEMPYPCKPQRRPARP